jgi:predicted metal-dependent phosphoesterase TrpH
MTDRLGRADLHIHTLASDGTSGIVEILDHVEHRTALDVIAITDHERIDAAVAARAMAEDHGLRFEVIVGEEITTRGGHLLGLYLTSAVPSLRSLRESIARIHDQGGLAIPAHPLVPYPLCAQGRVLRRLVDDPDPRFHPDALEAFNPTVLGRARHRRVVEFTAEIGLAAIGNSDAHIASAIGQGWSTFPGHTAEDLRAAILGRTVHWHGSFHATGAQVGVFGKQLRKYSRDVRAEMRGHLLRTGTGRDLGYPGGERRPAAFDRAGAVGRLRAASAVGPAGAVAAVAAVGSVAAVASRGPLGALEAVGSPGPVGSPAVVDEISS